MRVVNLPTNNLKCGIRIEYAETDGYGKPYSHIRKSFLLRREDWACASPKENYDTLSGTTYYVCGKRARHHIELPHGYAFGNGNSSSQCGLVCNGCAKYYFRIVGAKSLGLE